MQIPHAFQQRLSAEKTPTLCEALPAFEAMKKKWEEQQVENPESAYIIDAGLDKLETYRDCAALVPAYVLAMGMSYFPARPSLLTLHVVVNPAMKLEWYH